METVRESRSSPCERIGDDFGRPLLFKLRRFKLRRFNSEAELWQPDVLHLVCLPARVSHKYQREILAIRTSRLIYTYIQRAMACGVGDGTA